MRSLITLTKKLAAPARKIRHMNTALFGLVLLLIGIAIGHTSLPRFVREVWAAAIDGFGTANQVVAFTNTSTIGDSIITDTGAAVGIGTTDPAHKLDVEGNAEFGTGTSNLELVQNGQTFEIRHHDPGIAWRDISLNPHGGNVGIGTTAPGEKLDVSGNINATGIVRWGGGSGQRTETKDDAGAIASRSGFFQTAGPVNYYTGASSWQHLIESRHTNDSNNYALQIAGSFFDQNLYFRKTNGSPTTAWNKFVYENSNGNVGIGTTGPGQKLDVNGSMRTSGISFSDDINSGNGMGRRFGIYNWDGFFAVANFDSSFSWQSNRMVIDDVGNINISGNATANDYFSNAAGVWMSQLCKSNGQNCPPGSTPNLQQVTDAGNTTTKKIQAQRYEDDDANFYVDANTVSILNDIRPSIIYDRDNTGYFLNPNSGSQVNTIYANNWFRAQGQSGIYFEDYGGGWHMTDSTWIRSYGSKPVFMNNGYDSGAPSGVGCGGGLGGGYTFQVCGSATVNGVLTVDYLAVDPQNSTNEGGELQLRGAGSYGAFQIDNYQGNARIHTLAAGKQFEVVGGQVRSDGGFCIGGSCITAWPGAPATPSLQQVTDAGNTTTKKIQAQRYEDDDPNFYADLNTGGRLGGNWTFDTGSTLFSGGRFHIQADENLYLNPWRGGPVIVGGGGGPGNLSATGAIKAEGDVCSGSECIKAMVKESSFDNMYKVESGHRSSPGIATASCGSDIRVGCRFESYSGDGKSGLGIVRFGYGATVCAIESGEGIDEWWAAAMCIPR